MENKGKVQEFFFFSISVVLAFVFVFSFFVLDCQVYRAIDSSRGVYGRKACFIVLVCIVRVVAVTDPCRSCQRRGIRYQ